MSNNTHAPYFLAQRSAAGTPTNHHGLVGYESNVHLPYSSTADEDNFKYALPTTTPDLYGDPSPHPLADPQLEGNIHQLLEAANAADNSGSPHEQIAARPPSSAALGPLDIASIPQPTQDNRHKRKRTTISSPGGGSETPPSQPSTTRRRLSPTPHTNPPTHHRFAPSSSRPGIHSAAALFRRPASGGYTAPAPAPSSSPGTTKPPSTTTPPAKPKKPTRPPIASMFLSLQLAPERFLALQAAAKTYMLSPAHPERRACVGSRGRSSGSGGDADMVRLKLWGCVRAFLEEEGRGEAFFGASEEARRGRMTEEERGGLGEVLLLGSGPLEDGGRQQQQPQWMWPRDANVLIGLCMPLLRRMVTNERQRLYAIETRRGKGGRGSASPPGVVAGMGGEGKAQREQAFPEQQQFEQHLDPDLASASYTHSHSHSPTPNLNPNPNSSTPAEPSDTPIITSTTMLPHPPSPPRSSSTNSSPLSVHIYFLPSSSSSCSSSSSQQAQLQHNNDATTTTTTTSSTTSASTCYRLTLTPHPPLTSVPYASLVRFVGEHLPHARQHRSNSNLVTAMGREGLEGMNTVEGREGMEGVERVEGTEGMEGMGANVDALRARAAAAMEAAELQSRQGQRAQEQEEEEEEERQVQGEGQGQMQDEREEQEEHAAKAQDERAPEAGDVTAHSMAASSVDEDKDKDQGEDRNREKDGEDHGEGENKDGSKDGEKDKGEVEGEDTTKDTTTDTAPPPPSADQDQSSPPLHIVIRALTPTHGLLPIRDARTWDAVTAELEGQVWNEERVVKVVVDF